MPRLKYNTDKLFTDISEDVEALIPDDFEGAAVIYSPHTTCCVFQTENELLHLVDIRFFLDKTVPFVKKPEGESRNVKYFHDLISLRDDVPADERINGHSHIRSLYFNSSETIPVMDGKLMLGQWKRLFLVELDPERDRELQVTLLPGQC